MPTYIYNAIHVKADNERPSKRVWRDFKIIVSRWRDLGVICQPLPPPGTDVKLVGLLKQFALGMVFIWAVILALLAKVCSHKWSALATLHRLKGTNRRVSIEGLHGKHAYKDEAWIFINGVGTDRASLELILKALNRLFGRKVEGLHNVTLGMPYDLATCFLERDMLLMTPILDDLRKAVIKHVGNPQKKRVVLIAHSQGAILLSLLVDILLHSNLDPKSLSKIALYTLGGAADHFGISNSDNNGGLCGFGNIEHICNERDFVAQLGVLASSGVYSHFPPSSLFTDAVGRYCGKIFVREAVTGHLPVFH
ncbi:hypothetical protein I203_103421 [Kwoniella mangroviensis CBS 8507]|uniref:uncharacterized protein n=1 Tax=Kwoniella mangroviensis CBS 8507 TaxID=1296122 RepID=UPI00080D264A|nr:uncharacterized protein I203_06125 [Kwoniella mangroviensis CBS 8507]OCF64880.1 hypothetical protein I203_06125 [Kwoniella mangroviensis CBS 8507]